MKFILSALIVLLSFAANATSRCNVNQLLENAVVENLNSSVALDDISQIKKQADGSYFVEFSFVGEDYMDSGFFVFSVDRKACTAKRK